MPNTPKRSACKGTYHNGPDKRFVRCDVCFDLNYEANEGDPCTNTIEIQPMKIHKLMLIRELRAPEPRATEMLKAAFPYGEYATPEDAAKALEEYPGTWIVDGALQPD